MTTAAIPNLSPCKADRTGAIEPLCPHCGYTLVGLPEARCPECGRAFTWEHVEAVTRARRHRVFEHTCFDFPVSSFVRTLLASRQPQDFWRRVGDGAATKLWALWLYLAFVVGLAWCVTVTGFALTGVLLNWMNRAGRTGPDGFWRAGLMALERALSELGAHLAGGWILLPWLFLLAASALAPLILWQSAAACRRDRSAVLRVVVYSAWPLLAWALTYQFLFVVGNPVRVYAFNHREWMWMATVCYWLRRLVTVAAPVLWFLSFRAGLRYHLGLRRPGTVALAVLVMAALSAWAVWAYDEAWQVGMYGPGYQICKRLPSLMWPLIPR